ncbi:MAG TPA: Na+/H+ antiporter NhaA [Steroidobacteraceae bacterium]|nr:Na+/H+ antiporter NhaA [Steroidobacteraceae bacterium]
MSTAKSETLGGAVMLAAAVAAMLWANSAWSAQYESVFSYTVGFGSGAFELRKPFGIWINDALMAVFFLLVGLEIKREMRVGQLSSRERIALPAIAALGGMIVPALFFLAFNRSDSLSARGWAVPCATDIAFSLAVLRVVGQRVPQSLRLFLTAVAVLDDIGAILIIAVFYTAELSMPMLLASLIPVAALVALNRARVSSVVPYAVAGVLLWLCVLKSGIHPTLAGVMVACAIPLRTQRGPMLEKMESRLQPWVVFGILPLFALANAGVSLTGLGFGGVLEPVALGIVLGLFLGKTFGITLGVIVSGALRLGRRPPDMTWPHVLGIANLCGIGFTMSLLLAALSYEVAAPHLFQEAKLGVLVGSTLAAVAGVVVLLLASARKSPVMPAR